MDSKEYEYQKELAKIQIEMGTMIGFGIALMAASISVLVTMAVLDRWDLLDDLLVLFFALFIPGLGFLLAAGPVQKQRFKSLDKKFKP